MNWIYEETPPSAPLAAAIECYWSLTVLRDVVHPVEPDGCADLLVVTHRGRVRRFELTGTMTRLVAVPLAAGDRILGARFHPGMLSPWAQLPAAALLDQVRLPPRALRAGADRLTRDLARAPSAGERFAAWETYFARRPPDAAAAWAVPGADPSGPGDRDAADHRLSDRQFRRVCLARAGVTPKYLARILRFRRAAAALRTGGPPADLARLALDSGYYDQAHLNRDFREFAGVPPGRYARLARA